MVKKTDKNPCLCGVHMLLEENVKWPKINNLYGVLGGDKSYGEEIEQKKNVKNQRVI